MKTIVYAQISSFVPMHPKVRSLANFAGLSPAQALGHLAAMWSWTVVYSKGGIIDPTDLGVYPMFLCASPKEFEHLLDAMTQTGWLDKIEGGLLQVHDWDDHTGRVLEERVYERNKKQEQRLAKKQCPTGQIENVPEDSPDVKEKNVPEDSPEGQNQNVPRQTKQNKTKQNKTKFKKDAEDPSESLTRSAPRGEKTPGSQVWEAYTRAMQESWSLTPPRSAKSASQATKLVELVGFETAMKLAAYYPTRRSDFYVRTGHPFGTLLTDYMAMLREVNAGIKLTKGVVRDIVSKEESENACKFDQVRKETNIGLMTDEEFAEWEKEQALLLEGNKQLQLGENSDGNEF